MAPRTLALVVSTWLWSSSSAVRLHDEGLPAEDGPLTPEPLDDFSVGDPEPAQAEDRTVRHPLGIDLGPDASRQVGIENWNSLEPKQQVEAPPRWFGTTDNCDNAIKGGVRRNSHWRRWSRKCKCPVDTVVAGANTHICGAYAGQRYYPYRLPFGQCCCVSPEMADQPCPA